MTPAPPAKTPQADAVRLCELQETPLEVAAVLDALGDDGSGGVTLFVGRVRDHDHGSGVLGLDYSAHPTAAATLRAVCERIAEQYDVRSEEHTSELQSH